MPDATAKASPANPGELKAAMLDFVQELRTFRDDVHTKMKTQEERMTMLDRKTALARRAPLSISAEVEAPHQKAFDAYLRRGDDDGLRSLVIEEKGMSTADGGYLAAPQVAQTVQTALHQANSLRSIASVVTIEGSMYEALVEREAPGAGWADEATDTAETTAPRIERVQIPLHELSALPKASQRLLDDAAFDIESWLAERVAQKFARAEAEAFIKGDGIDKPLGILSLPTGLPGLPAAQGSLNNITIDSSDDKADALIDATYGLSAAYRGNAQFVMGPRTAAVLRKLKDGDGRFLWTDSLQVEQPAMLLGYPVLICEAMPAPDSGQPCLAFGDFAQAYTIAERPDLRVLRDPFSAKPHVLFYATKRVGGGVVDSDAYLVMTFA